VPSAPGYSVSHSAVEELNAQRRRAEVPRFRAELEEANARAREQALDREPPATVRAYRRVYGRILAAGRWNDPDRSTERHGTRSHECTLVPDV
jgi:hypothetical protein